MNFYLPVLSIVFLMSHFRCLYRSLIAKAKCMELHKPRRKILGKRNYKIIFYFFLFLRCDKLKIMLPLYHKGNLLQYFQIKWPIDLFFQFL